MCHFSKLWLCAVAIVAAMLGTRGSAHEPERAPPLSQQEQAALDQLLAAWEARSARVRTWSCTFYKWEYDDVWGSVGPDGKRLACKECKGTLKYGAPDKWLYQVEELKQWDPHRSEHRALGGDAGEHWTYDGESLYEFDHLNRVLKETRLPTEMRGKTIAERPLSSFCGRRTIADWFACLVTPIGLIKHHLVLMPLVLGDSSESLKKRYRMRIVTPPESHDQVGLEAIPRDEVDAACFSRVDLLLDSRNLKTIAIRVCYPGGQCRDVYLFESAPKPIDRCDGSVCDIARPTTPAGYQYILEDLRSLGVAAVAESPNCELLSSRATCCPIGRKTLFCKAKRARLVGARMLESRAISRRSPCRAQSRQAVVSDGGHPRRRPPCR